MTGEAAHARGAEGIERAKTWLEATMRATVPFYAPRAGQKLEFSWPGGGTFSFDMRGHFLKDDLDGKQFLAEVKNYSTVGNQGQEFDAFLRKVYRVLSLDAARVDEFDRFLWITWNPFRAKDWPELCSPENVDAQVRADISRVTPGGDVSRQTCELVSERVWIVVMSDAVEQLVPTGRQRWVASAPSSVLLGGAT